MGSGGDDLASRVTSTRKRTIVKDLSYHLIIWVIDIPFYVVLNVWYYRLPLDSVLIMITGLSAMLELLLHTRFFYYSDRLWKRISWGKVLREED